MWMDCYSVKKVEKPHPIEVCVPGSKSITNRALLIAALAEGKSVLEGVLFSDDSRHFLQALKDLGFVVEIDENLCRVTIEGCGGKIPCYAGVDESEVDGSIYVGSAGTAARFLTAFLGLSKGRYRIDSSEQMRKRPMKELLCALEELGAQIEYEGEIYHFPFVIGNTGSTKSQVVIDVEKSSQFLSALLISAPLFGRDFTVQVSGSHGMAYVQMTIAMMKQFGIEITKSAEKEYKITEGCAYKAREYQIEPDVSAACYFYAMSPLLKVSSKVKNIHFDSLQGDIRFLKVLDDMGCSLKEEEDGVVVLPPMDGILGGEWDLSSFSDQTLTLAAIAPFAQSKVVITNIGHIRYQECDRVGAIVSNLQNMGIDCAYEDGNLFILPGNPVGCDIETYDDHRVAMAFSLPGLITEGVVIKNPLCCRKTFENYFQVLEEVVLNEA